jgi:hypothetical protein
MVASAFACRALAAATWLSAADQRANSRPQLWEINHSRLMWSFGVHSILVRPRIVQLCMPLSMPLRGKNRGKDDLLP